MGLEPTRLATLAPKASVSTIPPPGQVVFYLCAKRDSNPHVLRTPPPQDGASTVPPFALRALNGT